MLWWYRPYLEWFFKLSSTHLKDPQSHNQQLKHCDQYSFIKERDLVIKQSIFLNRWFPSDEFNPWVEFQSLIALFYDWELQQDLINFIFRRFQEDSFFFLFRFSLFLNVVSLFQFWRFGFLSWWVNHSYLKALLKTQPHLSTKSQFSLQVTVTSIHDVFLIPTSRRLTTWFYPWPFWAQSHY